MFIATNPSQWFDDGIDKLKTPYLIIHLTYILTVSSKRSCVFFSDFILQLFKHFWPPTMICCIKPKQKKSTLCNRKMLQIFCIYKNSSIYWNLSNSWLETCIKYSFFAKFCYLKLLKNISNTHFRVESRMDIQ